MQGSNSKASASTISEWVRNEVYKEKNVGINTFRTSFATYCLPILNNYGKYIMAQRMRTSIEKSHRSYYKIHSSPEDSVKAKIEAGIDLQSRASLGTDKDNAYVIRDKDIHRPVVKREPGSEDDPIITPLPYYTSIACYYTNISS